MLQIFSTKTKTIFEEKMKYLTGSFTLMLSTAVSSSYLVVKYKNGGHTTQNMPMEIQDHKVKGSV